jgi:RsiW-degrading membrane proteinase PrsW (M82 family)
MLNIFSVIIPVLLAILIVSRFRSKLNSRDSTILIVSFLIATITVIPSLMIKFSAKSLGFELHTGVASGAGNILFQNLGYVLFSGFIDELNKYIVIAAYAYRRKEFDEPMAGILAAVMIALGFSLSENVWYIFSENKLFFGANAWRMLVSIPASLCFAVIMGFNAGMSKYGLDSDDLSSMGLRMKGLFLATLYHAAFFFFLTVEEYAPIMPFIVVLTLLLLFQVGLALFRAKKLHVRLMYSRSRRAKQSYDNPFSS